jgi:hypothetical protein
MFAPAIDSHPNLKPSENVFSEDFSVGLFAAAASRSKRCRWSRDDIHCPALHYLRRAQFSLAKSHANSLFGAPDDFSKFACFIDLQGEGVWKRQARQ